MHCIYFLTYFAKHSSICPSYASLDSIYCETGWDKLIVRREVKKLNLFYKFINNEVPEYLSELIPPTISKIFKLELFFNVKKVGTFRISKLRVFHVSSNLNILEMRKYHVTFRQETDTLMFCKVG
jgi:hypothetical protein